MKNIVTRKKMDRLPVKVTYKNTDQLLGIPELSDGQGQTSALAVYKLLKDWDVADQIQGCCFDTTSVNTGLYSGAAVQLEQMLGRSLLYLPCRHHICEILLKAVFDEKVSYEVFISLQEIVILYFFKLIQNKKGMYDIWSKRTLIWSFSRSVGRHW